MSYDFDTAVERSGIGNMIEEMKPQAVRDAGMASYWGASSASEQRLPLSTQ